jgi:predicted TIM-barrel fold metal-dependent hydrolase
MRIIDAHLHYLANDPETLPVPDQLDLKFLNVCVAVGDWPKDQASLYRKLAAERPARYAWCTSFDLPGTNDPAYADRCIARLDEDFADGAVGCKIWKNVGMELKDAAGRYILCDDKVFDPIYAHLAKHGWTLLAHIAEPMACWLPLDPASPHYSYYKGSPEWHMHGRTDVPSHQALMAARDRVLEKYPTLRVVGAHLGSLEYSLDEMAQRFDRYPNFAVDTSARLGDLAGHPRQQLLAFFQRYQDRILFGTDLCVSGPKSLPYVHETYKTERAFYETDQLVKIASREVKGLALPASILEKLYIRNAQRWYPGL